MAALARLLRDALAWAAAVGGTTAAISAVGRLLCLPPYWPTGFLGRCRPDGQAAAWLRVVPDTLLTTALLVIPLLPLAVAVRLAARLLGDRAGARAGAVVAGVAGGLCWVWLARRLEVSYLDFILGGYAIALGGLAGLAVIVRQARPLALRRFP